MEKDFFNCLPLEDKALFLRRHGQFVATTDFYGASIQLYSLYASFVEVYHHPVLKKVMRISFASDEDMGKHLRSISLSL